MRKNFDLWKAAGFPVSRLIDADMVCHPEADRTAVTRQWRQQEWDYYWQRTGSFWKQLAEASIRRMRRREALDRLTVSTRRFGDACSKFGETMEGTAAAFESWGRAWKRLEAP